MVKPRAPSSIASRTSERIRSSSVAVGGRSAPPMTKRRSVLWPTNVVTLVAGRARATASRYPPIVVQSQATPGKAKTGSSSIMPSRLSGETGPAENPHRPTDCVVMPCSMALRQPGSLSSETSEWVCRSMKPGATANPARSSSSTPVPSGTGSPTDTIRPSWIARSPSMAGPPVPS